MYLGFVFGTVIDLTNLGSLGRGILGPFEFVCRRRIGQLSFSRTFEECFREFAGLVLPPASSGNLLLTKHPRSALIPLFSNEQNVPLTAWIRHWTWYVAMKIMVAITVTYFCWRSETKMRGWSKGPWRRAVFIRKVVFGLSPTHLLWFPRSRRNILLRWSYTVVDIFFFLTMPMALTR